MIPQSNKNKRDTGPKTKTKRKFNPPSKIGKNSMEQEHPSSTTQSHQPGSHPGRVNGPNSHSPSGNVNDIQNPMQDFTSRPMTELESKLELL